MKTLSLVLGPIFALWGSGIPSFAKQPHTLKYPNFGMHPSHNSYGFFFFFFFYYVGLYLEHDMQRGLPPPTLNSTHGGRALGMVNLLRAEPKRR